MVDLHAADCATCALRTQTTMVYGPFDMIHEDFVNRTSFSKHPDFHKEYYVVLSDIPWTDHSASNQGICDAQDARKATSTGALILVSNTRGYGSAAIADMLSTMMQSMLIARTAFSEAVRLAHTASIGQYATSSIWAGAKTLRPMISTLLLTLYADTNLSKRRIRNPFHFYKTIWVPQ
tara:strand:- start:1227 stop:1760 length:534 start_codon:yes stop_codon:yes gene_type:complete